MSNNPMTLFRALVRLFPDDVRFAYGDEMIADFERQFAVVGQRNAVRGMWFAAKQMLFTLCDVVVERANTLYSHRSFHGRGRPNPGVVRPPNVSKAEWWESEN